MHVCEPLFAFFGLSKHDCATIQTLHSQFRPRTSNPNYPPNGAYMDGDKKEDGYTQGELQKGESTREDKAQLEGKEVAKQVRPG